MSEARQKGCCNCQNAQWEDLGMHGVRRLVRARGACGRSACWVIIIMLCMAAIVYQTLGCVIYYLSYPTHIKYHMTTPPDVPSPAVTLCNLNPWRLSMLDQKGWLLGLQSMYSNEHQTDHSYGSNTSSTDAFTSAGHTLQDMLLRCTHGLHECSHSNFTMVFTEYGFCYTFSNVDQYHLDLVLNIEEYEYCEGSNQRVGLVLIVHDSHDSPFLAPTHIVTSPGMHTLVQIHSIQVSGIDEPYSWCDDGEGYTQSGCQASCLFQLIVDRCRCTPFWSLHHQTSYFDIPVCSLHSHVVCVKKQVAELTMDSTMSICHCERPCEYTVYRLSTSDSALSSRDKLLYLTDKHQYTVSNQLLHAENIRARTSQSDINQHILAFSRSVDDLRYQVDTMKRNLQQVQQNLDNMMHKMYTRTWFHYYVGLNGIEKILRHGFMPKWKVVDVQFLMPLVSTCQMVLYSYDHVVMQLDMTSPTEIDLRRTLYLTMEEQLTVRMELAIQGLDNFTKVYYSFLDMKPTSSYIVTPERRYDASLLPIEAIADVTDVLRSEYSVIANLLAHYMEEILSLKNLLKDVYMSKSGLNKTSYQAAKEVFLQTNLDLQTHLDIFRTKAIQKIQDIVEVQTDHFKKSNETMFTNWARLVSGLDDTSEQLELVSLHHYPHVVDLGQDGQLYVSNKDKLLSDLADTGLSNAVTDSVDLLVKRISNLKSHQDGMSSLWGKFTDHYLTVWSSMLENQSLKDFYSKIHTDVNDIIKNPSTTNNLKAVFAHKKMLGKRSMEISSLDPQDLSILLNADFPVTSLHGKEVEAKDAIGQFRRLTNVRLQLQDLDRQIQQSYANLQLVLRQFLDRSSLDMNFINNNIVSLSVELSPNGHEVITESPSYSISQLLHDIGFILVLFLGASVITLLEIFDILFSCICCRQSSRKDKKSTDNKIQPPDTLPCNSRHVTFQFPTENHIGSPTKPALKRSKLDYYAGDMDIMTSLGDTHTEIL